MSKELIIIPNNSSNLEEKVEFGEDVENIGYVVVKDNWYSVKDIDNKKKELMDLYRYWKTNRLYDYSNNSAFMEDVKDSFLRIFEELQLLKEENKQLKKEINDLRKHNESNG